MTVNDYAKTNSEVSHIKPYCSSAQAYIRKLTFSSLLGAFVPLLMLSPATASIVYDNIGSSSIGSIGGFSYTRVADDITLDPGPRNFSSLDLQYFASGLGGGETVTIRIHAMDGAPTPGSFGFNTPGTELWSSGPVSIVSTSASVLHVSDPAPSVVLPDSIGVSLEPTGVDLGGSEDFGPLLYDPPSIGSSFFDYWLLGFPTAADDWGLISINDGDPEANFALRITTDMASNGAVPEPTTFVVWFLLLGLTISGSTWRHID